MPRNGRALCAILFAFVSYTTGGLTHGSVAALRAKLAAETELELTSFGQELTGRNKSGAASLAPIDAARATLMKALEAGNKWLTMMNATDVERALELFRAEPKAWRSKEVSAKIMSALDVMEREQTKQPGQSRSLRTLPTIPAGLITREAAVRALDALPEQPIGQYDKTLVMNALRKVKDEKYDGDSVIRSPNYGPGAKFGMQGTDNVAVRRDGETCWVIARETNEKGDWSANLDVGSTPILALQQTKSEQEHCGCARKFLGICMRYNSCGGYRTVGTGFTGYVQSTNTFRLDVVRLLSQYCHGTTTTVLTGYSRGGAIVNILAVMLVADNWVARDSLRMVTFGAPRALTTSTADALHGKFPQWRLVNKKDIVPAVPYEWWGFSHVGEMRCNRCKYQAKRNAPDFWTHAALNVEDHYLYGYSDFGEE